MAATLCRLRLYRKKVRMMEEKFRKTVAEICNVIRENGISIGMALSAIDTVKDRLHCSTALSDCTISADGVVVNTKEGEKNK
jgi:hypothetical protein